MKIHIPNDIQNYVLKNVMKRVLLCLVLVIAVIVSVTHYIDTLTRYGVFVVIIFYAAPLLFIFYKTGVPLKLIDSTWSGVIVKSEVKTYIQSKGKGNNVKHSLGMYSPSMGGTANLVNEISLKVKIDSGKLVNYKIYLDSVKSDSDMDVYLEKYKEGSRVIHIYGTKHLHTLNRNEIQCVICGECSPSDAETCEYCKHSIKFS